MAVDVRRGGRALGLDIFLKTYDKWDLTKILQTRKECLKD